MKDEDEDRVIRAPVNAVGLRKRTQNSCEFRRPTSLCSRSCCRQATPDNTSNNMATSISCDWLDSSLRSRCTLTRPGTIWRWFSFALSIRVLDSYVYDGDTMAFLFMRRYRSFKVEWRCIGIYNASCSYQLICTSVPTSDLCRGSLDMASVRVG